MPVTIEVTQQDIDAAREREARIGCRSHGDNCPVARAILRHYGETWKRGFVYVDQDDVTIDASGGQMTVDLPHEAAAWVEAYDLGGPVRPFAFDLDVDRLPDVAVVR